MAPQRNAGAGAETELPEYAGHYRLESCLGSGGMGVVHLARSTSGMKLAVKVVHAEFARDPEFRGRFRQEVAAARRVSGAFTAPVVDADPEGERPWMATLFIPGPTLAEHVKRNGPMDAAQLRRLMAGLAEALRDIHRVGVVHRDLKPSNVLLAEDGPKVIDFGISRPKDSELRTETGKLIGTPPFMAPEQFRRPREVGPAADVFALGSVLVHAATGRGPFDSDSPYVVAYQVVHDEPDLSGVPDELAPLVLRCLAKEPGERPTPDELMRALRSVAASYDTQAFIPAQRTGEGASPPKPRAAGSAPAAPRLPRKRAALLAATALALVTGAGTAYLLVDDASPGPRQTPAGASAPSGDFRPWTAAPASGKPGMPRCAYGAERLVCVRPGQLSALDPADGRVLWRRALDGAGDLSEAPVFSGGYAHVRTHAGSRLEAVDPASGRRVWELDVSAYRASRHAGGMLLLTAADGRVTGVDSRTGEARWTRRVADVRSPYFASFDGAPYALSAAPADGGTRTRVTAVDPDTGDVRWDVRLKGELTPVGIADGSVVLLAGSGNYGEVGSVVRYDPESGTARRVALSVPLEQAQATVRGDLVCLLGLGGSLAVVDMGSATQRWSLETSVNRGSAPVTDGRHVYFTGADGRLLAVDAVDGRLLGQTRARLGGNADRLVATLPRPRMAGPAVYATAPDGTVFAVDGRSPSAW
ncbi:serine/threonine-protein kinase [Streptomyces sp. DH24]|uniref:serine/threonine-protein kinase n=1 Tax=Streptomyces sp. DH24 TaxID=3040123 RepID=UPI0024426FE1|nr:serine/threonine-protein kinase [Streptomyces sp. DH24]MDG9720733.1 PQQ-binding-like beta-propeller repeat protein [Streptomyces sp. DH24]